MSLVDTGRSIDPLAATVKLLSDPGEMQKRLATLLEAEERANRAIALAGQAHEIVDMRRRIEEDLNTAKVALGEAKMQASMLVDTARQRAADVEVELASKRKVSDEEIGALKAEQKRVLEAAEATRNEAQQASSELQRLKAEYQNKLIEADNAKEQLQREKDACAAARAVFEDRLQALSGLAEQFSKALGSY